MWCEGVSTDIDDDDDDDDNTDHKSPKPTRPERKPRNTLLDEKQERVQDLFEELLVKKTLRAPSRKPSLPLPA